MQSKKPKKSKPKKKPTIFSTPSSEVTPPQETQVAEISTGVSPEQQPANVLSDLQRLENELAKKPGQGAPQQETEKKTQSQESDAPKKRRKFKRPPPENTIRMTIRQYWRFRTWIANRKLKLSAELLGAVLDGTDQILVEPLVDPVIGIIDEYMPEQWIEFIEEKSPILTFMIALFEAEQSFSMRLGQIAGEIRQGQPTSTSQAPPVETQQHYGYPKKGE